MLSPADAALCARDPALPGLATVLDPERLAVLAGAAVSPTYLRYKPGTSCVVGLMAGEGGFAAMTYPPARYAEVRARRSWWEGPDEVRFFDDICTALVPLSRDRRLKAARMLRRPEDRARFLSEMGLEGAALTLLRYKPGRRLVMRADLPSGKRTLLKAHGERDFAAAAAGAQHAASVAGAPLLRINVGYRCVLSAWIEGEALDAATADGDAFRRTGAELARLHRAALPAGLGMASWDPRRDAEAMAGLLSQFAADAERAAAAVAGHLASVGGALCPIHGDFSADQVVMGAAGPVVIDWDRLAAGHPARDLGSFLARLDADVIEGTLTAGAAEAAGAALLAGYEAASAGLPDGIAAFRAAGLLALLPEGFRSRRPDWPELAEAMLARIAALTDQPKRQPLTPGLAEASDPSVMAPKLAAAMGAEVRTPIIRLLRHKPGRRALLRYDLPGQPPMLGKLRAKGADRRTLALHRKLRATGLDGAAPHGMGVPEVLGEIDTPALWLQRLVPGEVLTTLLRAGASTAPARRAGRALAALHNADVDAGRCWSLENEMAVLDRALTAAAEAEPPLAPDIAAIQAGAAGQMAALQAAPGTGIHRDFYPDQVLIDGERTWLLDLDLYTQGDPMIDVGNFLAHLDELGLRLHGRADALAPHGAAFLAGYGESRPLDRPRAELLRLVSLARHINLSRIIPGRAHTTAALVRHCTAAMAKAAA